MTFSDHFSAVAGGYAKSRPRYPDALFDWLAATAPARDAAWDAGCGSGQASIALAERFARVVATDASAAQIASAAPHPRVTYRVAPAEDGPGEDRAFPLVTVAQALHWLDLTRFHAAVKRAGRPGALFAAFSYGPVRTDSREVNGVLSEFDHELHERSFWPPERRLVDEGYASIVFPLEPVDVPPFTMEATRDAQWLLDYVDTWSAMAPLKAAGQDTLLLEFRGALRRAWGDPARARSIRWPLAVRAGFV